MPRGPELSMDLRGQIIGMANCNKSARQIGHELGIPHTTVSYAIKRFRKTSSNEDLPRSGHPSKLTECNKNVLGRIVKKNQFQPLNEITNQLPVNVHIHTIR